MKDDLPYFSHDNDSRNHPKMKALRARYGWTGYGQFWALNEMIAGSAEARLDLSRKVVRSATACELGMTTEALDDFLAFLSNEDECGLINYLDGVVTTDRTQEDFGRVSTERGRKRVMGKSSVEKRENGAEKSENGAEESNRVEESRGENTRKEESKENKTSQKKQPKDFIPPTHDQVEEYVIDRQLCIDPSKFMDWYSKTDWKDNQGKPVQNWKNKLINWDAREREKNPAAVPYSKPKPVEEYRPKYCPKCGKPMTGLSCPSCFTNFDSEGNEV